MGFLALIQGTIAFGVAVILWFILELIVLPHIWGRIGLPALKPWGGPVYMAVHKVSEYIVLISLVVFAILWAIYCLIVMCIPGFFLDLLGWTWSPFWELREAGVFDLFDGTLGPFIGLSSQGSPPSFPKAVINFIEKGSLYLAAELGSDFVSKDSITSTAESARKENPGTPQQQPSWKVNNSSGNDDTSSTYGISDSVQYDINDRNQQCLEEHLINITPGMSIEDEYKAKAANQMIVAQCKLDQVRKTMEIMGQRLRNQV